MPSRLALSAALLGLLAFGCSSDDDARPGGEDMVLYATTKVLDPASLALVTEASPDLATMTFSGSTPALDAVATGDVIMGTVSSKTPNGVLRRVTAIEKNGGAVRLVTQRAGLADAIERGHIKLPLTRLRKEGSTPKPMTAAGTSFDQDFTLGVNDIELAEGVTAGASVGFGLGIDVDLEIGFKKVSGKIVLSGNQSATIDIHALLASKFGKTVGLGGVTFPPIVIQAGVVPIVIVSGLSASLGVEGSTSAAFDWSATEKASVDAGIEVATTGVTPILDGDAEATADAPKLHGSLNARGFVELKLDVAFNALLVEAGFYVGAQGYVQLDVDTAKSTDCFTMSRGVDGIYGINTTIFGDLVEVYSYDDRKELFKKPWNTGACTNDPLAVAPWARVIGATDFDKLPQLALLSDQSLVIGASTAGSSGFVTRLTPNGDPVWENGIGGVVGFAGVSPAKAKDGSSWAFGSAQTRPIATRIGADGAKLGTTIITSPSAPSPDGAKFVASKDGGVLMGGTALDASSKYVQWAAKLDASGNVVWAKSYGPLGEVRGIAEANDGGILLVGDTVVGAGAALEVTRISPAGDVVFAKTYGEGRLYGVTAVASGGLAATGATGQGNGAVVLRIADDGGLTWGFSYEDTSAENAEYQARAIIERDDGFLVAGRRGFAGSADFWAMQVSAAGDLGWSRTYGGAKEDEVKSVARTSDNGAILVGETYSFGGTTQTMVIRIPPSGAFEFTSGSGGSTKNVEGAKEPVPGILTTLTAAPSPMGAVAAPGAADDWPLTAKPAKHTKL